jgi:tetratricopeptide (TPR) repeat protein
MIQKSNLTEKELLLKEDNWLDREDETNLNWIEEGIEIYRNFSSVQPNEIRYKETLAYLLLVQGEDLKLRQHSYEKAIMRFNQVVKLDKHNARAFYRLGFLYFYQKEWAKSVDSFQCSLRCQPRQTRNQLQKEQQVKAHYYILKASQIIFNESLLRAEQIPSEDLDLFGEMKYLLTELKGIRQEEEKPYQIIHNGTKFREISEREYELLSDPDENEEHIILNQHSMNDVILSFQGRMIAIPTLQVPLLEYLMRHPEGVQHEEILGRMYRHSKDPRGMLRKNVKRLRERMKHLEPTHAFIETIHGGYRWNSSYPYRMFKHQRDVSTDLLLD